MLYLSNCLIRCVCKKSLLSFSYFSMVIRKNMQNQNKFVGNSLSLAPPPPPPPFCHCICVAIFIILESQSEKLWDQNYKLCPQNYKLRPQNYKLCGCHRLSRGGGPRANVGILINYFFNLAIFPHTTGNKILQCPHPHRLFFCSN